MPRKRLSELELRLGIAQAVIVTGAFSGSLFCAFYLGLFAGRRAGFESAMDAHAGSLVRLPIEGAPEPGKEAPPGTGPNDTSEVYARLHDNLIPRKLTGKPGEADANLPELGTIPSTDEVPLDETLSPHGADSGKDGAKPDRQQDPEVPGFGARKPDSATNPLSLDSVFAPAISKEGENLAEVARPGAHEHAPAPEQHSPPDENTAPMEVAKLTEPEPPQGHLAEEHAEPRPVEELLPPAPRFTDDSARSAEPSRAEAKPQPVRQDPPAAKVQEKPVKESKPKEQAKPKPVEREAPKPRPAEDVAKAVPPKKPGASGAKGWFAQATVTGKREDAEKMAKTIRNAGLPALIERADVRGQQYYRVLAGPAQSREQGERLVEQLKARAKIPGQPFLRLVR